MKILYPHKNATNDEMEEILRFAIEGRKRVKDQLFRIDSTYPAVRFSYQPTGGAEKLVKTLEEEQYPKIYYPKGVGDTPDSETPEDVPDVAPPEAAAINEDQPTERHLQFHENQRGISFDRLFGPYLKGAKKIVVTDPYIRMFYQAKNFMEFLETVAKTKSDEDEVEVHLVTISDEYKAEEQDSFFTQMQKNVLRSGIKFTWKYDNTATIHARHIVTDHGWKILLDRGLDIFQQYDMKDAFSLANRLQQHRSCKAFEVTYLRTDGDGT